jgi:hypothetical protein
MIASVNPRRLAYRLPRAPLVRTDYDGRQYVGIDLHRRRSVIVRMPRKASSWTGCALTTTRSR